MTEATATKIKKKPGPAPQPEIRRSVSVQIALSSSEVAEVDEIAKQRKTTRSAIIREAIAYYHDLRWRDI